MCPKNRTRKNFKEKNVEHMLRYLIIKENEDKQRYIIIYIKNKRHLLVYA